MAKFNLNDYETVEQRLKKFWKEHPDGAVETEVAHYDEQRIVIRASVFTKAGDPTAPHAYGIAEETRGAGFVNRENHVENCDTSAVGRALANLNYSGNKRPSREEMVKASRKPLTDKQKQELIDLATKGGMDEEEAIAKAEALDSSLFATAKKQLQAKANK